MVVDYRMKSVPVRHSQGQQFRFGQSGTSMHGSVIVTFRPGVTVELLKLAAQESITNIVSLVMQFNYFHVHYFTQIVKSHWKQDLHMTFSLIEDVLMNMCTVQQYKKRSL